MHFFVFCVILHKKGKASSRPPFGSFHAFGRLPSNGFGATAFSIAFASHNEKENA